MTIKTVNSIFIQLIVILALIASSYGFFSKNSIYEGKAFQAITGEIIQLHGKGLYFNDSVSMAAQARVQDLVTLIIGIPFLIVSYILANNNSIKAKLMLTGIIGYFLYTYTSYSFLAMYNIFFLIYVALMSLSLFAFIINFQSDEFKNLVNYFDEKFPRKYIGICNIIMGVCICLLWLGILIPIKGKSPPILEHYTTLPIQALDLGFIVPTAILSGILLIKNKSLGYLLASIIIIKGMALVLAIVMMLLFMHSAGVELATVEIIMFPAFLLILLINLLILFKNIKQREQQSIVQ